MHTATPAAQRRLLPRLERLEDLILLSGGISGNVSGPAGGLAGQTVFLDLNNDGQLGSTTTPFTPALLSISASTGSGDLDGFLANVVGGVGTAVNVQGLPATVQNVVMNLDLTNNSPDPLLVNLVSPLGLTIPQLPLLFTISPGQRFDGAFDGTSSYPITLAANRTPTPTTIAGTFAPQQPFNDPQLAIDNSNPNGTWGLVVYGGTPADYAALTLSRLSLAFQTPEPSTQTDALGDYLFTGLAAGTYHVTLADAANDVVTSPGGVSQTVPVPDGPPVGGINFQVQPAPDLTATSFQLNAPATALGQPVTVNYTLTNKGAAAAGAFSVGLYLSDTGVISATDPSDDVLLDTGNELNFAGLAGGASISGSVTVTLPTTVPAAFDDLSSDYLGFVIDPAGHLKETQDNQSNQGAGIDLALLGKQANAQVTTNSSVQQDPSLAVDPTNPNHLVIAYMDYSLENTGYAGIGVAVSTDAGKTWTNTSIPLPAGYDQGAAAPTVAFDSSGQVYVSFQAASYLTRCRRSRATPRRR